MDLPQTDAFSPSDPSKTGSENGNTVSQMLSSPYTITFDLTRRQEKSQDITISSDGDLIIRLVKEATGRRQSNGEEKEQVRTLTSFLVQREILSKSSPQFDALLNGHFRETDESIVDIQDGTALSLELWFRILHNTMTEEMYTLPVDEVIEAIEVCGYRHLQIDWLGEWAEEWFRRQDIEKKSLFTPIDQFLELSCNCKEASLFAYCKGLSKTNIWPLELHMKKSCQEILDSFKLFTCEVAKDSCTTCKSLLRDTSIKRIHDKIQNNFEGLCLDCMDVSKASAEATKNYLRRDFSGHYDSGCRVDHGQPTWYWSYLGQRTVMQAHQREKKKQRPMQGGMFRGHSRRNI
ncbi:BTB POZ fold protein [Rutstroemia sp. NJR-2017a WRK4]|nr:BTB POZ fold protein [Rutstroemia sp. NJR-2017a WRK4]